MYKSHAPLQDTLLREAGSKLLAMPGVPDAAFHNPASDYLRGLLFFPGMSQQAAARTLGISDRVMRYYRPLTLFSMCWSSWGGRRGPG